MPTSRSKLPDGWPAESDWTERLRAHFLTPEFARLMKFVRAERHQHEIYPAQCDVFRAFRHSAYDQTSVVILGQDPYHAPDQANGLSFSVPDQAKLPPSLKNIFCELSSDLDCPPPPTGDLEPWARQGVLLLNTVLTVRRGLANSHRGMGWESFTDHVVSRLNDHPQQIVFVLWGNPAAKKARLIDPRHTILRSAHPSPLSAHRGFFGSRPFSKTNDALRAAGRRTIEWAVA